MKKVLLRSTAACFFLVGCEKSGLDTVTPTQAAAPAKSPGDEAPDNVVGDAEVTPDGDSQEPAGILGEIPAEDGSRMSSLFDEGSEFPLDGDVWGGLLNTPVGDEFGKGAGQGRRNVDESRGSAWKERR